MRSASAKARAWGLGEGCNRPFPGARSGGAWKARGDRRRALPGPRTDDPGVCLRTHRGRHRVAGQLQRQLPAMRCWARSASTSAETAASTARVTGRINTRGPRSERGAYTRGVDVFTVVCGGLAWPLRGSTRVVARACSRSARRWRLLEWKPTRSPEVEAENEIDDVEQMLAAQNELRRRRGVPERTLDEDPIRVARIRIVPCGCHRPRAGEARCGPRGTRCAGRRAAPTSRRSARPAPSPTSATPTASAR